MLSTYEIRTCDFDACESKIIWVGRSARPETLARIEVKGLGGSTTTSSGFRHSTKSITPVCYNDMRLMAVARLRGCCRVEPLCRRKEVLREHLCY